MRTKHRRGLLVAFTCLLGACLNRENVGSFDENEATCPADLEQATAGDREVCITALIDDLSMGPWTGMAKSGRGSLSCTVEFARDGSFRLTGHGADPELFGLLFQSGSPMEGHYKITDLIDGEFFGIVGRQLRDMPFRSDLEHLVVRDDTLEFDMRPGDFPWIPHLMLSRDR